MQQAHPAPAFAVRYVTPLELTKAENILGIIAYGPSDPAFPTAPLSPITGAPMFELWTASTPTQPLQIGAVTGAFNDEIAFGAIRLYGQDIESATERAYLAIFDYLEAAGGKTPIRFWNYLAAITGDDHGMERYRRFNIGRHRAFTARLQQKLPPAASAVGGHAANSIIYFLAAPNAAAPIENPRQISAYDYPQIYGPRSPSFSRAAIYTYDNAACLFVSGTASIVGHETRHAGNLKNQIAETAENLRAIIAAAEHHATAPLRGEWALKIYLQNPAAQPHVAPVLDDLFGPNAQRLYLRADICRTDLLVEIEAFKQFFF